MTHAEFWGLIDTARSARGELAPALHGILAELPPPRIVEFDAWFWAYFMALSRNDLWAAVYIINGGCSDDSFDYFRRWLVGQGEARMLAAIRDPETLADGVGFDELLLGAAEDAYRDVTGRDLPRTQIKVEIPDRDAWPADRIESTRWRDPLLKSFYPRLYARYVGDHGLDPEGEITHERFWALVEEAREKGGDIARALRAILEAGPVAESVGFARWIRSYNEVLVQRKDLRGVTRVLLGQGDRDMALYLRGWLLSQGEAVVHAALRDPDALATLARDPPRCYYELFEVAHGGYQDEPHVVPGVDAWAPDWPDIPADDAWTAELLRARLPRLTAGLSDQALDGRIDVTRLDKWKRAELADELLAELRALTDDRQALVLSERAVRLAPEHASTLAARGRVRARLGRLDEALADYDAAIGMVRHSPKLMFERAQLRWAKGDREGAIRDAQVASPSDPAAKRWLDEKAPRPGPPRRVRHAKFGDGVVVSIAGSGADEKLTIKFAAGTKTLLRRFVEVLE
jgi:tetratricopeptide (TPR) repeat protein